MSHALLTASTQITSASPLSSHTNNRKRKKHMVEPGTLGSDPKSPSGGPLAGTLLACRQGLLEDETYNLGEEMESLAQLSAP